MNRRLLSWLEAGLLVGLLLMLPTDLPAAKETLGTPPNRLVRSAGTCEKFALSASPGPPMGKVGASFRYQFRATNPNINPAYQVVAGQIPPGLKVSTKGLIQGVPLKKGKYAFTIEAALACSNGTRRVSQAYVLVIQPRQLKLSVRCHPDAFAVEEEKLTSSTIAYLFSIDGSQSLTLTSSEGLFQVRQTVIGRIREPLTAILDQSSGKAVEKLTIPASIYQAVKKYNSQQITYTREFRGVGSTVTVKASVTITLAAQPALSIQSMDVFFTEDKGQSQLKRKRNTRVTLTKGQTSPLLYAQVHLNRPGVIKAYWQINGKPVSGPVSDKTANKVLTVAYPHQRAPLNKLPAGQHIIQYVIQSPKTSLASPKALLVVRSNNTVKTTATVQLNAPQNDSTLDYQGLTFRWAGSNTVTQYRLEISSAQDAKVLFTTTTQQSMFHLNGAQVKNHLAAGTVYRWRVLGLNNQKQVVAQSPSGQFQFASARTYITGQIVVVTGAAPQGRVTLKRLQKKYQLKTIETITLGTINRTATVFGTHRKVRSLVQQIRKEPGVLQVQPNHLFQTMAEPKSDLQQIYSTLNLPAVHRNYQGRGVRVAIVDTGVDTRHPDLKQRVVRHASTIRNNPYRAEIHGTALAGVMAASINNYGITGIAPLAELLALRACWQTSDVDPEGSCSTISIAKAIDMAIEADSQIVNMSFGAAAPDGLMMRLLDAGAKKGVIFVAPVGNQKNRDKLPFPASHSKVLAVGGWDQAGRPYPNAQLAGKADVCAPASNIFTTLPGKRHNFISGTSISAAIVSGILAVAKEKHQFLGIKTLPAYDGDICRWQEKLIHRSVCKP